MKNKLKIRVLSGLILLLLSAFFLSACGGEKEEADGNRLFYLNQDGTKIVSEPYEPQASAKAALVEEYMKKLSENTGSVEYQKVIPDKVKLERYEFDHNQLHLYFNDEYLKMSAIEEILCRGAIVHTMMQIEGISEVSFFVEDQPLTDANGVEVGSMTNDSFVENPGEKINTISEADITLYFASEDGSGLVREQQNIHYSSNISQEKLVMERLLEGPSKESENAKRAIPADTKLISVSVMDGVCFVNLGEGFLVQDFEVTEDVVIYSIVNSLTELPTVNTVQISVNGNTDIVYREKLSLKDNFKRNLDLVVEEGARVEEDQTADTEEKERIIDTRK